MQQKLSTKIPISSPLIFQNSALNIYLHFSMEGGSLSAIGCYT